MAWQLSFWHSLTKISHFLNAFNPDIKYPEPRCPLCLMFFPRSSLQRPHLLVAGEKFSNHLQASPTEYLHLVALFLPELDEVQHMLIQISASCNVD